MESSYTSVGRHMEDDEIEKYSMGQMSHAQNEAFEEHLLICEQCRDRLVETESFISAVQNAGKQVRSVSPNIWSRSLAAAAAAAVVLTAALLMGVPLETGLQEVRLYAMRGADVSVKVNAHQALLLIPDLTGLPSFPLYGLQIVNASGKPVLTGAVNAKDPRIQVNGIPSGIYFVRLSSPGGELLREYGLESDRQ